MPVITAGITTAVEAAVELFVVPTPDITAPAISEVDVTEIPLVTPVALIKVVDILAVDDITIDCVVPVTTNVEGWARVAAKAVTLFVVPTPLITAAVNVTEDLTSGVETELTPETTLGKAEELAAFVGLLTVPEPATNDPEISEVIVIVDPLVVPVPEIRPPTTITLEDGTGSKAVPVPVTIAGVIWAVL